MPAKKIALPDVGVVHLYKRRGTKSMRLSITHTGEIRVTLPPWAPYRLGVEFAYKKRQWLQEKKKTPITLNQGQRIGRGHRLVFTQGSGSRITTRITNDRDIRITLPKNINVDSAEAQEAARKVAVRALKKESEILLPQRLAQLAAKHSFSYRSIAIKRLSSRWGSCSESNDIILNCYLIQLPWNLIDYVLLHELVHTRIMAHGEVFWAELAKYVPDLTATRKEIRTYQPILIPQ
jgi:predicted metal-dependent hydrolase